MVMGLQSHNGLNLGNLELPGLSQQELEKLIDEAPQSVFSRVGNGMETAVMSLGMEKKHVASWPKKDLDFQYKVGPYQL